MTKGDPRVVLIANPGADLYGSDRMVLETVRALIADDRRVVLTTPNDGPLVPLLREAGAEVVRCPTPIIRKGLVSPRGLLHLIGLAVASIVPGLRTLRRSGAGTVIVNTITPPLWLVLARLSGRYTLCHVHESEASVAGPLRRALYLPLVFADRILVNSGFTFGVLRAAAPWLAKRTTTIYNAVAGPEHVAPPRKRIDGPVRLLYVGRLSRRKGPHVAIEALRQLTATGVDAQLSVVGAVFPGNEAYAEDLHQLVARYRLEDKTEFLGFKQSVWADVADSDIVVIPSTLEESFGNAAVEAALAARPAVVSEIGGLPEACSRSTSSVLVRPGDAVALADAITLILNDWSQYSARAVSEAPAITEAFSSRRYARELVATLPVPHSAGHQQGRAAGGKSAPK